MVGGGDGAREGEEDVLGSLGHYLGLCIQRILTALFGLF